MRTLYSLLLYLLTPLILLRLYWRGRKAPGYRQRWAERFGCIPALPGPCLWVHAVSLGETRAALPLIRALLERYPDSPVLVTTTTPTGSRQVRASLGNQVHHVYAPYDLPGAVARFLDRTRPRLALIMETELWPNLFAACQRRGTPVVVANARLSARSAKGYGRLGQLSRRLLERTAVIAAQAEADAQRFRELGAPRVTVTGNLKYDLALPEGLLEQGLALRRQLGQDRPVWIAASTHQGEDEVVLDAFERLRQTHPQTLLVLVPRHPERFDAVAELCRRRGWTVARRGQGDVCVAATGVYLGDTLGELLLLFAAADLAFVGGSLVPVGGHNVLEPAALGLPVLFGPHMFNFTEASQRLLEANAARQVADGGQLAAVVAELLTDPQSRTVMSGAGRAVVEANRGALTALLTVLDEVLAPKGG